MSDHKKQEEDHGESAPMWIVSFADLVTLMLSFFVILAAGNSQNNNTSNPEFTELAAALQAAFNNTPIHAAITDPHADFNDLVKKLMALAKNKGPQNRGDSQQEGLRGKGFRVQRIRDGMEITVGGSVMFQPFSVEPTEQGKQQLKEVFQLLKGHRNIIEIRGHAGEQPWPPDWTTMDVMKLSYDRAAFVAAQLLIEGIDPRAIRLTAAGANEPAARKVYDPTKRGDDQRVELIVRESLLDNYVGDLPEAKLPIPHKESDLPAGRP